MPYRSITRRLQDLRLLLERLEQDRHSYNIVSFAQLRTILRRRIKELTAKSREQPPAGDRRAA
jgi:hypothetical protein